MSAITIFRAIAWFGVAVIFWSLNVRWGSDPNLGGGPPTLLWERMIVAAGILALLSAVSLSVSGRKGNPPSWVARGIAGAGALSIAAIVLYLQSSATGILEDATGGQGWTWLAAGGGLVLGAVVGTLGLKTPIKRTKKRRKKRS